MNQTWAQDVHSFSEPQKIRVRNVEIDLTADFAEKKLKGAATLYVERVDKSSDTLTLDTRDLKIHGVQASSLNGTWAPVHWTLGQADSILGAPLAITIPGDAMKVKVDYETAPTASGLQWLEPSQTEGGKLPFLFSQNESIHARSWIPLQDSPGVRISYTAAIRVPDGLVALMSANQKEKKDGAYHFTMELPIPAYLIALAVGDLAFQETGSRTGVYAEPGMLQKAAHEFEDTEKMIQAVESLYGPYRWGRYDLLVLPPSFPFGGMENPRLTFATPTVIAGDKSLVGLVSHELAHSWSGNLVTNATWSDFWLNEGFTSYIENRIQEVVYGKEQALMEQVLARRDLDQEMASMPAKDQILHIDLKGRDPDEGTTQVPYIKGALFLRRMEELVGRPVFDKFLMQYFDHFAFQSITTHTALEYINKELVDKHFPKGESADFQQWVYEPGLPKNAPQAESKVLSQVAAQAKEWASGRTPLTAIHESQWSTQQWLEFLQVLPRPLSHQQMKDLDERFHLTQTHNDEILGEWLLMAVQEKYEPAYPRLHEFLMTVGRMKMIRPLYAALNQTPEGRKMALAIFAEAAPRYHPIAQTSVQRALAAK